MTKKIKASRVAYSGLSLLLSIIVAFSSYTTVNASEDKTNQSINFLSDEDLSTGVHYTEEDIVNYRGENGHRLRVNHLVINPSDSNTKIISAKAMDTVSGRETVLEQATREVLKGNNVIAGINADSYDISSNSGINRGIQVQNGYVIQSQPNDVYTSKQPAFYVRKNGKVNIGPLNSAGSITIGDAKAIAVPLLNRNDFTYATDTNNTRIFTSNITETHKLTHVSSNTNVPIPAKKGFALIKIEDKNFDYAVKAGETYTGTVEKTYTEDGFTIPDGYIVYAGYGDSADAVSSIPIGTEITYSCNLYTNEDFSSTKTESDDADNDIESAVTSFHLLAKDGVKNDDIMSSGADDNERTVVGITKDGIIQVLACNKPSANMTQTSGTNFSDITDYMMEELGCEDVLRAYP